MHQITQQQFTHLLKGESFTSSNGEIIKPEFRGEYVYINNVEIDRLNVGSQNTLKSYITLGSQVRIRNLVFKSNVINTLVVDGTQIENLRIWSPSKLSKLELKGVKIKTLHIENYVKLDYFLSSDNTTIEQFKIKLTEKDSYIDLFRTTQTSIESFEVYKNGIINSLNTHSGTKIGLLRFYGHVRVGNIRFLDSIIEEFSIHEHVGINSILVTGDTSVGRIELNGGEITEQFSFQNLITDKIILINSGTQLFPGKDHKLIIDNVALNFLGFINFHSNKPVLISGVYKLEDIGIVDFTTSSFGRLELINNDFEQFDFVVFENSNLINSFIAQTSFPNVIKKSKVKDLNYIPEEGEMEFVEDKEQARLFFEQLKTVFQKQGNRKEALKYQALELQIIYDEIELTRNPVNYKQFFKVNNWPFLKGFNPRFWKKSFWSGTNWTSSNSTIWDKQSLWFNKVTNNFGTSWGKSLGLLVITSIILYNILFLTIEGKYHFPTGKQCWVHISQYFKFTFPISSLFKNKDWLSNYTTNSGTDIILAISYIIFGLLYYQLIVAFRKFNKK